MNRTITLKSSSSLTDLILLTTAALCKMAVLIAFSLLRIGERFYDHIEQGKLSFREVLGLILAGVLLFYPLRAIGLV